MELQTTMETFIRYKKALDDVERQGLQDTAEDSYEKQFMKLRDLSTNLKTDGRVVTVDGEKKCNANKNRYKDIVPYDHTRVKLTEIPDVVGSDYINASHIMGVTGNQNYIAAQGPMPDTVNDFWRLLWDSKVKVIMMACNEYEGSPPKLRCQRYWSTSPTEVLHFDDISVTLTREQKVDYDEFVVRLLKATRGDETRDFVHLHYTAWPDRGVPKCVQSILYMIELMREFQSPYDTAAPPVVVHCSAGCGRTGTILVLDYVSNMIKFGKLTSTFSLFDVIFEMRKQRMAIVQSPEQYTFVHEAVVELFNRQLQVIEEHPYYDFATKPVAAERPKPAMMPDYEDVVVESSKATNHSKVPPVVHCRPGRLPSLQESDKNGPLAASSPKPSTIPRKSSTTSQTSQANAINGSSASETPIYAMPNKVDRSPSLTAKSASLSQQQPLRRSGDIPVTADPTYAEVGYSVCKANAYNTEYAYADPNSCDRWALQHVARNQQGSGCNSSSEYAEIPSFTDDTTSPLYDGTYATVDNSKDSKPHRLRSDSESDDSNAPTSSAVQGTGTTQQASSGLGGIFRQVLKTSKPPSQSNTFDFTRSQPQPIVFQGVDISFPNRVDRPKYGPRAMKPATVARPAAVRL